MRCLRIPFAVFLFSSLTVWPQTPTATISGRVLDPTRAVIPGAIVEAIRVDTSARHSTETNGNGLFTIVDLLPGNYRVEVSKPGFRTIVKPDVLLHLQDVIALNFDMSVGSTAETVTVEGGAPLVNTQDASVSTVIDRNFAENLPLNGRSFQSLIQLTPGVVLTVNNGVDTGQFSVNGQRATTNYWTVDGVGANTGISAFATPGNGLGGTLGSTSVFGGTNSLVSVDALQEFRIQTSTYAPEFGRTPGAQISIVTRSGTNQFHGTAFEYLRNDVLDANDWFADNKNLAKPKERQNDFGGTVSGPLLKDRTFFFYSYEGLRLRLPQTRLTNVPDLNVRQNASAAMQPFVNAYPLPNGADNAITGIAQFNASFSNPGTLDANSIRIDHRINDKVGIFGRYAYSPSAIVQRGPGVDSLSNETATRITEQSGTAGVTWSMSGTSANDFRFNYSLTDSSSYSYLDNFGGAVPLATLPLPSGFTVQNAAFGLLITPLGTATGAGLLDGKTAHNQQRQVNIVDSVSLQRATHSLKFGLDFRRLTPEFSNRSYFQQPLFTSIPKAQTGNPASTTLNSSLDATFLFRNLGVYVQDTWQITPRANLTYGLRWDIDFVPSTTDGPKLNTLAGFDLTNLSGLVLAANGTPPYGTRYDNVGPRVGIAYQLLRSPEWQTVLRGGFGVFYDLASAEAGNGIPSFRYPFGATGTIVGGTFPLTATASAPPAITPPGPSSALYGFDPRLELPYALQWNVALEQALGRQAITTVSYIGSTGQRLIQTAFINAPTPNLGAAQLVSNTATSSYNSFQLQFQRRLLYGLQALASYTWSHSIDTASASSLGTQSNALSGGAESSVNRGASDFDVRHAVAVGVTYDLPTPKDNLLSNAILKGWSTENVFQARSAPPVDVYYDTYGLLSNLFDTNVRPNIMPGQPFYLFGSQYPGGKAFNPLAFSGPPIDPTTKFPSAQGNLGRNTLRGFGANQWDFAVHRDFPIHERVKLQFRGEMFNLLNHPNFGQPIPKLGSPLALNAQFGKSNQMLGQSLSGSSLGAGGFNPLYQIGGPRSLQFALKLTF